jgi:hypothetical protein
VLDRKLVYMRRGGGGDDVVLGGGVLLFRASDEGGVCGRELLDRLLLRLAMVYSKMISRHTDC